MTGKRPKLTLLRFTVALIACTAMLGMEALAANLPYALIGSVGKGEQAVAVIKDTSTGKTLFVKPGQYVGTSDYVLMGIKRNQLVLELANQPVTLVRNKFDGEGFSAGGTNFGNPPSIGETSYDDPIAATTPPPANDNPDYDHEEYAAPEPVDSDPYWQQREELMNRLYTDPDSVSDDELMNYDSE